MGVGRRILNDGRICEGFFFNGSLIGKVKEVYPDGQVFVGYVNNYIKHGNGVVYFKDGSSERGHIGDWVKGKRQGAFSFTDTNG